MTQNTYNDNSFDVRTASLLERLHGYFEDVNMQAHHAEEQTMPLHKFRTLILTAEIYEYTRLYVINREDHLSEYFGERTLKQCLENVVEIEKFQESLGDIQQNFYFYDMRVHIGNLIEEVNLGKYGLGASMRYKDYARLHEKGLVGFSDEDKQALTVGNSVLWNAKSDEDKVFKFGKLFAKAKESLDENNQSIRSSDPEVRAYNKAMHQRELSKRIAHKAKTPETISVKDYGGFDFLQFIIEIQKKAEEAPSEVIINEFSKALEMLRNVFMTDAEDIFYIRTGDFSMLKGVYKNEVIEHFYTELPFRKYYDAKEAFIRQFSEDIDVALGEWRIGRGYIGRKLTQEEYNEFLQERKDSVVENMKRYDTLWKLRMHSGGLDSIVTPENFARMFYRRKGVDRYFIELQWELEELTNLMEENKNKPSAIDAQPEQTVEQKAVSDFVDKIILLANRAYEKWNNQRIIPAVHKPEVHIVIKKEELIGFIQREMKNHFHELSELCYPATSTTKQEICKYVVGLQKANYFGALPNKFLADILAPIVELSPGTTKNYLSKL
jgi:hypothetical protein